MTEAANALIGKVVDLLFGVAKREMGYMWNCTQNVEIFKKEVEKLKQMRERVQEQINSAKENGDHLLSGVQEWMNDASARISKADDFIKEEALSKKTCFNLHVCVNLSTLYHYGKKAKNDVSSLLDHQKDGKDFENKVSVPTSTPGIIDLYQKKNLDGLDTHKFVLEQILKSIEDESIQIIGIYGLGGVGKTTLAKEVAAIVKNQFADVVFITVSQTVNVEKIKEKVEAAAKRIINGDKIIIILDDVWRKIELEEVGIPCGSAHMNCKILLTSRKINVCESMNCNTKIDVKSLPDEEAWRLFKSVVGETVESDANMKEIAVKVAKKCGGLPLFIQVVGNALKDKDISLWKAAVDQLGKHAPHNIHEEISEAYMRLRLSYDSLKNENAQSFFLLCSVFPEDYSISIEHLLYYVVGLEKFDGHKLEDARNSVLLAVNTLKSSCLLLDGEYEFQVRMHDVVREVALLIASEDNNKFLVEAGKGLTEWQPRNKSLESYTGISLMENNISKLPDYEIQFPRLDFFLIGGNGDLPVISNEFILSIKNVKVLEVNYNDIRSLPESLSQLKRLRMLNLRGNKSLREVSILGELKALEILFLGRTRIEEIPKEIGQLINLRLLEAKQCNMLSYIAPHVISKLRHLEELQIGYYSEEEEEGKYNSLVEIHELSKLTFLGLFVPHVSLIPEGYHFERLKGFDIQIGGNEQDISFEFGVYSESKLLLNMSYLSILSCVQMIKVSQSLTLVWVENLNNILPAISYECVEELKSLNLRNCKNLFWLIDSSDEDQWQNCIPSKGLDDGGGEFKEILFHKLEHLSLTGLNELKVMWNCPDQYLSLNNLVTLSIWHCKKLVRLFSVNIACRLVNLQMLEILFCESLEEVIWECRDTSGKSEINIVVQATNYIVFPSLSNIYLYALPNLTSFHSGNSIIKFPSLVTVNAYECDKLEKWGNGSYDSDTPKLERVNNVERPSNIDEGLPKYRATNS